MKKCTRDDDVLRGGAPKCVAVVVTYNRLPLLKECLQALRIQTLPFSRVIVVDNASTDGTGAYLESLKAEWNEAPKLTVLSQAKNRGGAGGFYVGMRYAKRLHTREPWDYLLLIDDDAILADDYMEVLTTFRAVYESGAILRLPFSKKQPVCALAGAVETNGSIDLTHRRNIGSKLLFTEPPVKERRYNRMFFTCDTATFCGLVLTAETFLRAGLPRKEFFLWYDDTEYCLRFGKIHVVPDAVLDHRTKNKTAGANASPLLTRIDDRYYYGCRNRYITAREHFGILSALVIGAEYRVLQLMSLRMLLKAKRNGNKTAMRQAKTNLNVFENALWDGRFGQFGKRP